MREGIEQFEPLVRSLRARPQNDEWQWVLGHTLTHQGMLYFRRGLFDQAQARMEESLTILRSLGQQDLMTVEQGRYAEAETGLQESLRLCNDSGNRWGMGTAHRYLGLVKMAQGKLGEAQSLFRTSIETFGDYFIGWDIAKSWVYLGQGIFLFGQLEKDFQMND